MIAPQSLSRVIKHKVPMRAPKWKDKVDENSAVDVYQPLYLSFSNRMGKLRKKMFTAAARRALKRIKNPVDALYGHFWHVGVLASQVDETLPVFVACGESKISVCQRHKPEEIAALQKRLRGVIYVGTKSLEEARELNLQQDCPYIVAPNGYDPARFHVLDRKQCRQELNWSQDAFVVSFVGSFTKRKGVDRLAEALNRLNENGKVYSCFIGDGEITPACENILHLGRLGHDDIVKYLCASDVFVLPTNNEGCCNAIVEALACGLPVVSSNQLFNHDILDDSCSVQLDPMDVQAIADAIHELHMDEALREKLSAGAIRKAEALTIGRRGEALGRFMYEQLGLDE